MTHQDPFLLQRLSAPQKQAVQTRGKPTVVFAGAGSGKTRVIVTRIAALLSEGVPPGQILAVTFTNKAAREMSQRLADLCPGAAGRMVQLGTFHSMCARWLREFAEHLGFTSQFTIYDDGDSTHVLKQVLKDMQLVSKAVPPKAYMHAIDQAKSFACQPADYQGGSGHALFPVHGLEVYRRYQNQLHQSNAMDFGDLMMNMLILLRHNLQIRGALQGRFRHILVDEYQDTNTTQFQLLSWLSGHAAALDKVPVPGLPAPELFVVGDDDQSIYSWRGADPSHILNFQTYFPGAQVIKLGQNYRCSGQIVEAAARLIQKNHSRAAKDIWTENAPGAAIDYVVEYDSESEALWVARRITQEAKQYPYEQVAVLYRTNAQSRQLEDTFRRYRIPYRIYGSLKFYDRVEIKDLVAYFRWLVNPRDDVAFQRLVNTPTRGLGKKAQSLIEECKKNQSLSLYEAAEWLASRGQGGVPLGGLVATLQAWKKAVAKASLGQCLPLLLQKIAYKAYIEKKFPQQVQDKMGNIHELGTALSDYSEQFPEAQLGDWLNDTALNAELLHMGEVGDAPPVEEAGGVSLMTLHSAKGLEFPRAYITGVEDGLIPHTNAMDNAASLEEERRLFYVGMTRAGEKLSLVCAQRRKMYHQWLSHDPSRFMADVSLPAKAALSSKASLPSKASLADPLTTTVRRPWDLKKSPPGRQQASPPPQDEVPDPQVHWVYDPLD